MQAFINTDNKCWTLKPCSTEPTPRLGLRTRQLAILLLTLCAVSAAQGGSAVLRVRVENSEGNPVPGVTVSIEAQGRGQSSGETNQAGIFQLPLPQAGRYSVTISSPELQTQREEVVIAPSGDLELQFTAIPRIKAQQELSVKATPDNPVEVGASPPSVLQREEMKSTPMKPATVADSLPLLPGVTRSPAGELEIAGANPVHSAMVVNFVDVTDPQTGQFGMTIPVDSVESVNVYKTPYLAQYGQFTAGVVAVETKSGGNRWHFELEDPFPEFRIRSGHLVGMRSSSPRLNLEGPFIKDRLFASTNMEYVLEKTPVRTLPFPFNESRQQSFNLFSQLDYVVSARHTATATFHTAPQSLKFANLDFFNPQPVTPNLGSVDQTGAIIDRFNFAAGVLQSTLAVRTSDVATNPQSMEEMFLTPTGNRGSYFSSQDRNSRRYQGRESFSLKPINVVGVHNIELGANASGTGTDGFFTARPVNILDSAGRLRQRIKFQGGGPYERSDLELDTFINDHWLVTPRFSLDAGSRVENQRLSSAMRIAPRVGFALNPVPELRTVVRGGAGVFYEHVPLDVYAFGSYPQQVVSTFDSNGVLVDGPRLFLNLISESSGPPALADREPRPGNFVPYSVAENIEVEHQFSTFLKVRAGFLQNDAHGLVIINPSHTRVADALVLSGTGSSRYRQLEFTGVLKFKNIRQMFFSYVNSRSRGNINQFNSYLGDIPTPVVRSDQLTNQRGDLPNRFLAWGTVGLPLKMEVTPTAEFHTGFPYAVTDVLQQYAGVAYSDATRFRDFFSLDARLSRSFAVNSKYSVRLALTGLNMTNRFNPLAVHSNIDDPQFGQFFGTYKRRFRIDFDVLF